MRRFCKYKTRKDPPEFVHKRAMLGNQIVPTERVPPQPPYLLPPPPPPRPNKMKG